jgi:hypothetical protein
MKIGFLGRMAAAVRAAIFFWTVSDAMGWMKGEANAKNNTRAKARGPKSGRV